MKAIDQQSNGAALRRVTARTRSIQRMQVGGYRPEIDGLRAIAVLSVVLFHAGFVAFSGGYVGVDVFFVISGYLITGIISREIGSGRFSLVRFYERRARRILPALFAVMAFCLISSALLFSPADFDRFGTSLLATTAFASNILFWQEQGYFGGPAELTPLLHTWSLAVEEQYYIFFPLFLLVVARWLRARYATWLVIVSIASLALSIYGVSEHPLAAFYLAPTRAWELLLGGLIALGVFPRPSSGPMSDMLCVVGLAGIVWGVVAFTPETPFPGLAAIVPTVGTALVIVGTGGESSRIRRMLSFRPLVFIGLISYSLYLWHWPLLVFSKYFHIRELSSWEATGIVLASVLISIASWRFVEEPFRAKRVAVSRPGLFTLVGTVMATLVGLGIAVKIQGGMPGRFDGTLIADQSGDDPEWHRWGVCQRRAERLGPRLDLCTFGSEDAEAPTFILWGDSHARSLASGVHMSAGKYGYQGNLAIMTSCAPLLGVAPKGRNTCLDFNDSVVEFIDDHAELETVILAARWALYADGSRYKNEGGARLELTSAIRIGDETPVNSTLFELGLLRTITGLEALGRRVVVVEQTPEVGYPLASAYFVAKRFGWDLNRLVAPTVSEFQQRNSTVAATLEPLLATHLIRTVRPWIRLCGVERCSVSVGDQPLYRDDDHLSTFGSRYVSPAFDVLFSSL